MSLGGLLMFALVLSLFGVGVAILLSVLVAAGVGGLRAGVHSVDVSHQHAIPDYERRYLFLGSLILLLAALFALGYSVSGDKYQEWAATVKNPKPRVCDWTLLSNEHCHYEPIFHHVNESVTVTWRRVAD